MSNVREKVFVRFGELVFEREVTEEHYDHQEMQRDIQRTLEHLKLKGPGRLILAENVEVLIEGDDDYYRYRMLADEQREQERRRLQSELDRHNPGLRVEDGWRVYATADGPRVLRVLTNEFAEGGQRCFA